jgi:hypothetical protein
MTSEWLFENSNSKVVLGTSAQHSLPSSPGFDRATQYSRLPEIHINGGVYWIPAFAGMTDGFTAATSPGIW